MVFSKIKTIMAFVAVALFTTAAVADINPKFNAGVDVKYSSFKYTQEFKNSASDEGFKLRNRAPGHGIFAGVRLNDFLGAQLGYETSKFKHSAEYFGIYAQSKLNNTYFDVIGFYPVAEKVELFASAGIGRAVIKESVTGLITIDLDTIKKVGPRAGFGAKYAVTDKVSLKAGVNWQKFGKKKGDIIAFDASGYKSFTSLGLGLQYEF